MGDVWHCKQIPNGSKPLVVCERESLQAEIKRLRAAGDALASAFEEIPQWPEWFYKVYETWLEVRRG